MTTYCNLCNNLNIIEFMIGKSMINYCLIVPSLNLTFIMIIPLTL